jgi:hypothetical protein
VKLKTKIVKIKFFLKIFNSHNSTKI